jgi:hypothetical protein
METTLELKPATRADADRHHTMAIALDQRHALFAKQSRLPTVRDQLRM